MLVYRLSVIGFGYVSVSFLDFVYRLLLRNLFTLYDKLLYSPTRPRRFGEYNIAKCPPKADPPLAEKL